MRGIDDLKKWSDDTSEYVIDNKEKEVQKEKVNKDDDMDLLGMDINNNDNVKNDNIEKKENNNNLLDIDLLGNDIDNTHKDLFDLNLNINTNIDITKDDDFFELIASKKTQLHN